MMYFKYFCLVSLIFSVGWCFPPFEPGYADSSLEQLEKKALQNYLIDANDVDFFNIEESSIDVPDRIIGGVEAAPDDAPFLAQIFRRVWFSNRFMCGGSLITPQTILTAAHCVSYFYNYRIRYGSHSRLWSPFGDAEVKEMKPHPKFVLSTVQNDIALFILKKPIQPGANVKTIQLETDVVGKGTNATLFGFGLTKGTNKEPATKLQKTTLTVLDDEKCEQFTAKLNIKKNPGMFCASAPNRSACNGDSGGPLVNTKTGKQIGIVSFGTRLCPPGSVNVYTNVSHYIEWINKNKVE